MNFEDELLEFPFSYDCPYCHEILEVKLSDESFTCTKCGSKFYTTVEKEDFRINTTFIDEEEDGQK